MLEISELLLPAIVIQILQSIKELVCHTFDNIKRKTCKTPHIQKLYFVISHENLPILYCRTLFCILFSVTVFLLELCSRRSPPPKNILSIICQGVSGRRPSFLAIHAKLAKKNTSTFWGFEPGTNFCKKIEPGTKNFAVAIATVSPPTTPSPPLWPFFFIYCGIFCVAKTSPPAPTRPRPAAPTN